MPLVEKILWQMKLKSLNPEHLDGKNEGRGLAKAMDAVAFRADPSMHHPVARAPTFSGIL